MFKIAFRLAALAIIVFLLLQFFENETYDQRIAAEDKSFTIAANLDVKATRIQNDIYFHYKKHGELPKFSSDLPCKSDDGCNVLEFNGIYYVTDNDVWLSFEPYFDGDKIKYDCKVSRHKGLDMTMTILKFCGVLDLSTVPYL